MSTPESDALQKVSKDELKQLLTRNWMTHDAMWFGACVKEVGIKKTNAINRAAVRGLAAIEAKRLAKLLGLSAVGNFAELRHLLVSGGQLLIGDYLEYRWDWSQVDQISIAVESCFAHDGIKKIGLIEQYECGIYDRIDGWLTALGIGFEVSPNEPSCLKHTLGHCAKTYRITSYPTSGEGTSVRPPA